MNESRRQGQAFLVMPFQAAHSDRLKDLVREVCGQRGIRVLRADDIRTTGFLLSKISNAIGGAEFVIADLTGMRPNVLYELGVAHERLGVRRVILIRDKQEQDPLPIDLQAFEYIPFDLASGQNRRTFAEELGNTIDSIRSKMPPSILESALARTEAIIQDLETLDALPPERKASQTVWFIGGLSGFAIDPHESFRSQELRVALLKEQELLLRLARQGCLVRCIISPPDSRHTIPYSLEKVIRRLRFLLQFLQSDDDALDQIDWAVSPCRQNNLYVIGNISCIEGYRKGMDTGLSLNLRQTGDAVSDKIQFCQTLFNHLETKMLISTRGPESEYDRRKALRDVTIKRLKQSLTMCLSLAGDQAQSKWERVFRFCSTLLGRRVSR